MGKRKYKPDRKRWELVRREALDRDGWRCQQLRADGKRCGRAGRLEVDHIRPLAQGGAEYDLGNLQTLCRSCHIEKTRAENSNPPGPERLAWDAFMAT